MAKSNESGFVKRYKLEQEAIIKGFIAASSGKLKGVNPHAFAPGIYLSTAWNYGWDCWSNGILPWAMDRELDNGASGKKVRADFRNNRELPNLLVDFLGRYSGS